MSAREICRLEGIQFFSDGCRVFDWLGFPLWHTPHYIELGTASMQTVCAYGHGHRHTSGHMKTLDGQEHRETDCTATTRTTKRRQNARMKDCDPCIFKSIRLENFSSCLLMTLFLISPKHLKHCYASSAGMIQNIDLLSNPKVAMTNLNHRRTTLVLVTKSKVGTEAFYGPFVCFERKTKITASENKQVIECIKSSRFNVAGQTNYCCHSQHLHLETNGPPMRLLWKRIELRYFKQADKQQKSPTVQLNIQDKTGARHLR